MKCYRVEFDGVDFHGFTYAEVVRLCAENVVEAALKATECYLNVENVSVNLLEE